MRACECECECILVTVHVSITLVYRMREISLYMSLHPEYHLIILCNVNMILEDTVSTSTTVPFAQ